MDTGEKIKQLIMNPENGWWIYLVMGVGFFTVLLIMTIVIKKIRKRSKGKIKFESKKTSYRQVPKEDYVNRESDEEEDSDDEEIKTTDKSSFLEKDDDREESDVEFSSAHITNSDKVGELDAQEKLEIEEETSKVVKEMNGVRDGCTNITK